MKEQPWRNKTFLWEPFKYDILSYLPIFWQHFKAEHYNNQLMQRGVCFTQEMTSLCT